MNKLKETVVKYPQTEIWNDSCAEKELLYAIENGAVGATTNPVIVYHVLKSELNKWELEIKRIVEENPTASEDDIAWEMIELLGTTAASSLLDIFHETKGKRGRISFQVNAKLYNDSKAIIKQAVRLANVVENAQIKVPTSKAGIEAFEELTYLGVSINATVSFTLSQAIAVAEAVERGLNRRLEEGKDISTMNPVCTLMVGRLDDYLKAYVDCNDLIVDPACLEFAGIAVAKKAYRIYQEKGYRTKLLIAAFRNHHHWSQFIGGNIILTIPYNWQVRYNQSSIEICSRIDDEVEKEILSQLLTIDEFEKAYATSMPEEEFQYYGAFVRTMNQFLKGYDDLVVIIRAYLLEK